MLTVYTVLDISVVVLGVLIFFIAWYDSIQSNHHSFRGMSAAILTASLLELVFLTSDAGILTSGRALFAADNRAALLLVAKCIWSGALWYVVAAPRRPSKNNRFSYGLLCLAVLGLTACFLPAFPYAGRFAPQATLLLKALPPVSALLMNAAALLALHKNQPHPLPAKSMYPPLALDGLLNIAYLLAALQWMPIALPPHVLQFLLACQLFKTVFRFSIRYPYQQLIDLKERLEDMAAKNAHLYTASEKQRNLLEIALAKVGMILSTQLDLRDTLAAISDMVADMMNSNQSLLALLNDAQDQLQVVAVYGINTPPAALPLTESLGGEVIANNKALYISNLSLHPAVFRPQLIFSKIRSIIAAPLIHNNSVIGVIEVYSNLDCAFDEQDALFLTALGHHAGAAIGSAMLYEETKLRLEEEKFLSAIAHSTVLTVDPETIVQECTGHIVKALDGDIGLGCLTGRKEHTLEAVASVAFAQRVPPIDLSQYPNLAAAIKNQRPAAVESDIFQPLAQAPDNKKTPRQVMVLPLAVNRRLLGAILVGWRRFVTPERLRRTSFAALMAQQVALGLEKAHLYNQVKSMALSDGLTNLANRRNFDMFLKTELRRAASLQRPLSLIMLDLDKFKVYNDTFGHLTGDKLLAQIGRILHANVRSIDLPARYGGEEFSIILPECDAAEAVAIAEQLRQTIASGQFPDDGGAFTARITASFGIATYDPAVAVNPPDAERIIAVADKSLYQAKQQGRNCTRHANILA